MKSKKKRHRRSRLKAEIAIRAAGGADEGSLAEQYEVSLDEIAQWRRHLIERAPELFRDDATQRPARSALERFRKRWRLGLIETLTLVVMLMAAVYLFLHLATQ